jgi:hypothetical protein
MSGHIHHFFVVRNVFHCHMKLGGLDGTLELSDNALCDNAPVILLAFLLSIKGRQRPM